MRIIIAAVALTALSFLAGVAGDLSAPPANAGQSVTLRIPPPIPADAPRAAPLPVISTRSANAAAPAAAASVRRAPAQEAAQSRAAAESLEAKPRAQRRQLSELPKVDQSTLAKAKQRKRD